MLGAELRQQAGFLQDRVPTYAQLLATIELQLTIEPTFVERLEQAWAGRTFSSWYDRPLLILAALRFDAASPDHPFHSALCTRPLKSSADGGRRSVHQDGLTAALQLPSFWHNLRTRSVQTNEPTRAIAWLWPATLLGLDEVALVDLGCSAGLNLVADALGLQWRTSAPREAQSETIPPGAQCPPRGGRPDAPVPIRPPRVVRRLGYDLKPGDVYDEDAMAWLHACIWPGEIARLARLDDAIEAGRESAERGELTLHAASLPDVPVRLDQDLGPNPPFVLAYQTIVRDYLTPADQAIYRQGMVDWLARHEGAAAWVELEHDPRGAPCVIELHRWQRGLQSTLLATCGPHPATVTPL